MQRPESPAANRPGYMDDDYDEIVTRDNEDAERIAANLIGMAERCAICGQDFADDPENKYRHATGELVHMTCYNRMWEQ